MYDIYVIPIVNVDGVVLGNSVTNLFGQDISLVDKWSINSSNKDKDPLMMPSCI